MALPAGSSLSLSESKPLSPSGDVTCAELPEPPAMWQLLTACVTSVFVAICSFPDRSLTYLPHIVFKLLILLFQPPK